jgi:hypothetical protein
MISIVQETSYIHVMVADTFSLQDYQELERCVLDALASRGSLNLLLDLREMHGYTLDVAIEDIRFTRSHRSQLPRIAVVTDDQWILWSAWLNSWLADAQIQVFEEPEMALEWVLEARDIIS